jgi:hypothetical protein
LSAQDAALLKMPFAGGHVINKNAHQQKVYDNDAQD